MAQRPVPREHGAWMMLLVPYALGLVEGPEHRLRLGLDWLGGLLFFLGGFLTRAPLVALLTERPERRVGVGRWLYRTGTITIAGAVLAAHSPNRAFLALWGGVALLLFLLYLGFCLARAQRSLLGELIGILGLTTAGPIGYALALGTDETRALVLWVVPTLYFASSIGYVRWRVDRWKAQRRGEPPRRELLAAVIGGYVVAVLGTAGLGVIGWLPPIAVVALMPILGRHLWDLFGRTPSVVQVGVSEILLSLLFFFLAARFL
ncbi:MAG: hypothetical protein KatS3mg115_1704 [Candidatus Poribacteria bacterium]|nr:MAG: hypothetical protein KatS3mg115_1704 [Candidatus Poribacteria bacterium]